jgi:hypothetical protein
MEKGMDAGEWEQLDAFIRRALEHDEVRFTNLLSKHGQYVTATSGRTGIPDVLTYHPDADGRFEHWAGSRLEPGQIVIYGTRTGALRSNHEEVRGYARCASCSLIYDPSLESCPACHVHSWPDDHTSCTCGAPHPAPIPPLRSQRHTYECPTQANPHNGCTCGGVITLTD